MSSEQERERAEHDFGVLCRVYNEYQQNGEYATPEPIHLDRDGGIIVLGYIDGVSVSQLLARNWRWLPGAQNLESMKRSAQWLRNLHDLWDLGTVALDVDEKLSVIEHRWSPSATNPATVKNALQALREAKPKLENVRFRKTRIHGDFTPDNVMICRSRTVGIDIGLQYLNAAVYDIGPFLNHVRLLSNPLPTKYFQSKYEALEKAFLEQYGWMRDPERHALWWVRLYFMLSYWRSDQERGVIHAMNPVRRQQFAHQVKVLTESLLHSNSQMDCASLPSARN